MMFFPPYSDEIVITDTINPKAIRRACEEILDGFEEFLGEITEAQVLNMIRVIYEYPKNPYQFIVTEEEIAEKQLEDAKISLLKKTEEVGRGDQEKEIRRKRIVQFLSIIENPKLQKYKAVLSEVLSLVNGEYL